MSIISVGAKEAEIGFETGKAHSYLVYEDAGGGRYVTSLTGVEVTEFPPSVTFDVDQINIPYAQADETDAAVRVEMDLDFGWRNPDDVWTIITRHAIEIRDAEPIYDPLFQNSNSFVASLLNVVGIDYEDALPHFNGRRPIDGEPPPERLSGHRQLARF